MANVRFIKTTKKKWLERDTYDSTALYFCEDTGEMFKGNVLFTDGVRIVPTKADLPECPYAADGVVYYVADTKNGYMMSPDRTEWLQTIYAPVADVTTIPEGEEYNVVTTVGAVRDIEKAIYDYIAATYISMLPKITNITLSADAWTLDSNAYYQDVALDFITTTSKVDLQPTYSQLASWQDDGLAFSTVSQDKSVRVWVMPDVPQEDFTVQVSVQEVVEV